MCQRRNAKIHDKDQVARIAASMAKFGWTVPCMVADDGELIAGHGRVLAAIMLGLKDVPVIRLSHLDDIERRGYRIADNKRSRAKTTFPNRRAHRFRSWATSVSPGRTGRTGKVLNDDRADWREVWALFPGDVAYVWHGAACGRGGREPSGGGFCGAVADHLGQGPAGAEPRRLPLAAQALLVCGASQRQGPLGG